MEEEGLVTGPAVRIRQFPLLVFRHQIALGEDEETGNVQKLLGDQHPVDQKPADVRVPAGKDQSCLVHVSGFRPEQHILPWENFRDVSLHVLCMCELKPAVVPGQRPDAVPPEDSSGPALPDMSLFVPDIVESGHTFHDFSGHAFLCAAFPCVTAHSYGCGPRLTSQVMVVPGATLVPAGTFW